MKYVDWFALGVFIQKLKRKKFDSTVESLLTCDADVQPAQGFSTKRGLSKAPGGAKPGADLRKSLKRLTVPQGQCLIQGTNLCLSKTVFVKGATVCV